jgi:hypothetical protein
MTLSISSSYYEVNDLFNDRIPAFNPAKNKLTSVSKNETTLLITDICDIAKKVNSQSKPFFTNFKLFYCMFINLKNINAYIKKTFPNNQIIKLSSFSRNLMPSASELKDKIWAVHLTNYIYPDAIMRPFITIRSQTKKQEGIALLNHFSLGEMVRPHSRIQTWKDQPFALITTLRDITSQLVGIYPYDTSVLGDWEITSGSILIIPEGDKIPEIYAKKGIRVIRYNPKQLSIRKVVGQQIACQEGIKIKMVKNILELGSPAYLYGDKNLNINHSNFLDLCLAKMKIYLMAMTLFLKMEMGIVLELSSSCR